MPNNPQSGGESSTDEPRIDFVVGQRTQGTGEAERPVRRMDSLARLVHSHIPSEDLRPVATSVAFGHTEDKKVKLVLAHNTTSDLQEQQDARRLGIVQKVLKGETPASEAAHQLVHTSGLSNVNGQRDELDRLTTDLRKLRDIYEGKTNDRDSPQEREEMPAMRLCLQETFGQDTIPFVDVTRKMLRGQGTVHAETAVASNETVEVEMPIGVSKLSCGHCASYFVDKKQLKPLSDFRGTHAQQFPNWTDPDNLVRRFDRIMSRDVRQYASDSASSPDHSSGSEPHSPQNPKSVLPQRRASQDGNPERHALSSVQQLPQKREHTQSPPHTPSQVEQRPDKKRGRR